MNVSVRDFEESDLEQLLQYWYHSPAGFIESMGVDLSKLVPEEEFKKMMLDKCRKNQSDENYKINALAIELDGKAVGFHAINPVEPGQDGVFHAHIWDENSRGIGVGQKSYPLAALRFIERFELQRLLFKTPLQNSGAIKVKEKLGIRVIGEEAVGFGVIKEGTMAKVFELTKEEAQSLVIQPHS